MGYRRLIVSETNPIRNSPKFAYLFDAENISRLMLYPESGLNGEIPAGVSESATRWLHSELNTQAPLKTPKLNPGLPAPRALLAKNITATVTPATPSANQTV
jgi:hypothetical protein